MNKAVSLKWKRQRYVLLAAFGSSYTPHRGNHSQIGNERVTGRWSYSWRNPIDLEYLWLHGFTVCTKKHIYRELKSVSSRSINSPSVSVLTAVHTVSDTEEKEVGRCCLSEGCVWDFSLSNALLAGVPHQTDRRSAPRLFSLDNRSLYSRETGGGMWTFGPAPV